MTSSFTTGSPIRLDLPSSLESIHLLDALISEMLDLLRIDKPTCHQINLAVIEAGTNAIKHGNTTGSDTRIRFEFRVAMDKVTIVVQDGGQDIYQIPVINNDLWQ